MKRLLLATTLLCASPAYADFPVPTDITHPFSFVAPTLKTDGTANTVLDSTVTPMPVVPLTNIPIPSPTNRIVSDGPYSGSAAPYCLTKPFGGATCNENKFRTLVDFSHMLPDDPVRNFGQYGQSHLHCFFGNGSTNAGSTYKSLRNHSLNSTAAGTDANGTGYWQPCIVVLNPYGDGKNYAIRPNFYTVYYTENPATDGNGVNAKAPIPIGTRYVTGFDMDATWDSVNQKPVQFAWLQSYVDAANSAQGRTRYFLTNPTTHQYLSQTLYQCTGATPASTTVLQNADGSDPFNGTCEYAQFTGHISANVLTVDTMAPGSAPIKAGEYVTGNGLTGPMIQAFGTSGTTGTGGTGTYALSSSVGTIASETMYSTQEFIITLTASRCFDGTNLWSPGGYKNVIPSIYDHDISTWICPDNYYKIPALTLEVHLTQYGWADRKRWDLSSDIAFRSKYGLSQSQLPPGTTFHTDWDFGWDNVQMLKWEQNCVGVEHHTGHECDTSQIDSTEYLKGGYAGEAGAGGRAPQIDFSVEQRVNETDHGWMLIPPAWSGSLTNMKMHH